MLGRMAATPDKPALRRAGPFALAASAVALALVAGATHPARAGGEGGPGELAGRIAAAVAAHEKAHGGRVGLCVVDLTSGRTLAQRRADEAFVPASTQKLLTAAAALERLGAGFQFDTRLYLSGDDLLVIGDFDPTLGDPHLAPDGDIYRRLDAWAAAVARRRQRVGDLVLRAPAEAAGYRHGDWPRREHRRWYAAPVAPLNFHTNCFGATFTMAGGVPRPHVTPASRFIRVLSRVRAGDKHVWWLRPRRGGAEVVVGGTVRTATKTPLYAAADDPPMLLGRVLADRLARAGVRIAGRIRTDPRARPPADGAEPVARVRTPLAVVLRRANKRSLNLAAECMFLRAGDGAWAGSAEVVTKTLMATFGLADEGLTVRDGSGLSRRNRVTPASLAKLLAALAGRKDAGAVVASLPISGIDGTLRNRLDDEVCRGRVRAKTGSLAGVSALAGYVCDALTPSHVPAPPAGADDGTGAAPPAKRQADDGDEAPTPETPGRTPPQAPPSAAARPATRSRMPATAPTNPDSGEDGAGAHPTNERETRAPRLRFAFAILCEKTRRADDLEDALCRLLIADADAAGR